MQDTYRTVRRATVGTSVLGWVALACLILNGAFWGALMLDLLNPPAVFSAQTLQAALSIVAFALILPLFYSMLLPSSPAGRLLQRQTWHLPGQIATTFAAVFLTWMAMTWLRLWWAAQPNVAEAGQDLFLTITSLIAGVLVPALSWCVMTPEQWIAQIEQARHVKRVEYAMKMEETSMRAAYARAVSLLNSDLTNLTIAQRRELAGILGGFARTQQHALASIAQSWKDMYGVECQLATIPDQELLTSYQEVADLLTDGAAVMASSAAYAGEGGALSAPTDRERLSAPNDGVRPFVAHPDAETNARERNATRSATVPPRTTDASTLSTANDTLQAARRAMGARLWTRADLESTLSIQKTKASEYIKAWRQSGDIVDISDPAYHYQFIGGA